ncbi:hypothetical protein CCACVL1_16642 [Corchorus capsularis]|uniref:Uncharacterized protein n=1 Tax=Corchorus capsularis TaxID=210143 RepID=A0A1R3HW58_COCAP|nr:hypothetical protein CCACVL1_16642 [Corchorus capsularis]
MRENREHSSASKEIKMEDQEEAGAEIDSLFCYEIDLYFNQEMTNKEVEAKDEVQEARSGTYKSESDGDSSWEEVQNSIDGKLGAEIAAPDQKKTDKLEEAGQEKEPTSNYDCDESSWEAGEIDLNRRPCSSSVASSDFIQEQLHE